jgi:Lon protease-like protein
MLPLHIFEERYKAMTARALETDKRIAMALLCPGWEKCYTGQPKIESIVCIGKIVAHERLPDGKYNFLLQGTDRAQIVREIQSHPYRIAELNSLPELPAMEIDLCNQRRRLISVFSNGRFSSVPLCQKFLEMLASSLPTSQIVDVLAFSLLEDITVKQQLLAETNPRRRAERVAAALENLQPV